MAQPKLVLVTLEVCYYMPRFPNIVTTFLWQTDDLIPRLPRIHKFLEHWRTEIKVPVADIKIAWTDEGQLRVAHSWL